MENCYRSTPKWIGAFIDTLYQNPTTLLLIIAGIVGLTAATWWYNNRKTQ